MAFTVQTTSGASLTLQQGDKITSVAGQSRELLITELAPYAQGMRRRARILSRVDVSIASFDSLGVDLAPSYDDAVTVKGQSKIEKLQVFSHKGEEVDGDYGPQALESKEVLYFNNADTTQDFGVIRAVLQDPARGLFFPNMFTVQMVPKTKSGGRSSGGIPPSVSDGTKVNLEPVFINVNTQVLVGNSSQITLGDAVIKFPLHKATQAQLLGDSLIEITPQGQSAIAYRIKNADGLKQMQTHHWMAYLERVR